MLLRSVDYEPDTNRRSGFPFSVPIVASGCHVQFHRPVTIFVGDNGTGKSTLLEALAIAIGLPTVGGIDVGDDTTLESQRQLARALKLVWTKKTRKGFFLRAEDFFNFCKSLRATREESEEQLRYLDEHESHQSQFARNLASLPFRRTLGEMKALYGDDLDSMSHGESFMQLFAARLRPGSVFILDEPEAPLSPLRQLALMQMIQEYEASAQFIIATHSPILMAYPGADLYALENGRLQATAWDELEHVRLTRDFLNHPDAFLRRL